MTTPYALKITMRYNEADAQAFRDGAAQHDLSLNEYNRRLVRQGLATPLVSPASGREEVANLIERACDPTNPEAESLMLQAIAANVKGALISGRFPFPPKELAGIVKMIRELRRNGGSLRAPLSYEQRLVMGCDLEGAKDEPGDEQEGELERKRSTVSPDVSNPTEVVSDQDSASRTDGLAQTIAAAEEAASPTARVISQEPPAAAHSPSSRQEGNEQEDGDETTLVISSEQAPEDRQNAAVGSCSVPDDYPWRGRSAGDVLRDGRQRRNGWMDWLRSLIGESSPGEIVFKAVEPQRRVNLLPESGTSRYCIRRTL